MLLALLVYAYCTKQRSSRQIERLCEVDVAYRIVCGGLVPDHTTIARFRREFAQAAQGLFVDVLEICREAGLLKVGVVAVDGTKMAGVGALRANRTRARLEAEVAAMFDEAEQADQADGARFGERRGDEVPEELRDARSRKVRLDRALAAIEEQRGRAQAADDARRGTKRPRPPVEVAERELEAAEAAEAAKAARRAELVAQGRRPPGRPPGEVPTRLAKKRRRADIARRVAAHRAERGRAIEEDLQANVTDPDSRIMSTSHGFIQGYNAQAAVDENGIVIAAAVTNDANDYVQCKPMMDASVDNIAAARVDDTIGTVVFDAGYHSRENLETKGPDRLIADGKAWKRRREQAITVTDEQLDSPDKVDRNHYRLRSEDGAAVYAKRQHMIEPVFGDTKHNRGIRSFVVRGLDAVNAEWQLLMMAHNIRNLHRNPAR